jgi:hypothetical protein
MAQTKAIIITTINPPTPAVQKIAKDNADWNFIVVGDKKTPADWQWEPAMLLSVADQAAMDSVYAAACPFNHYARKNIGYIQAIRDGAVVIAETDDDNIPYDTFLGEVSLTVHGRKVAKQGWENVYRHFTPDKIWPRGFPLEYITESLSATSALEDAADYDCPIQQFLADGDPDVDAVYRLTIEAETKFLPNTIILGGGTICPFNSQNTIWWPEAYPLLYLPSFVSFRMTDIWRSFVAQICLYQTGRHLAFRDATVFQTRNEHSLIKDFKDEVPGYLNNVKIIELLQGLSLSASPENMGANLKLCYETLVGAGIVPETELPLVDAWLQDLTG